LDSEAPAHGKIIVKSASGVFADCTPFDAPGSTPPPAPLTIRPEHLDLVIYLAVPIRVPNGEETACDRAAESLARSAVVE
ncbi:type VI secretion system baseplate subunit TssK, partial [Burkholderia pseudomallei]